MVYFGVGESMVWTSPALPHLRGPGSPLTERIDESWLVSCFAIGQLFGPLISGLILDSLGRKTTTFIIIMLLLISCVLLGVATTPQVIYWARVFGGFSFGMAVSALPVYVAEICDAYTRGTMASIPLASRSLGYFIMYSVGPYVSYYELIAVIITTPLVALLFFFLLPESPQHLLAHGKVDKASRTIQWLMQGVSEESIHAEIITMQKHMEEIKKTKGGFKELLKGRANIRALYISSGLLFFLQMCGMPVIISIAEPLFILAQVSISSKLSTAMFGGVMFTVGICGPTITKHFGYKIPLLISATGASVSLAVFGTHFYLLGKGYDLQKFGLVPVASLIAYVGFINAGFANSSFAMVGELFAHNVKAVGTSLMNCIGFGWALVSVQIFYNVRKYLGTSFAIWNFAMINALAVPFLYFFVPNTSDKSLLEIQDMLSRPWFNKHKIADVDHEGGPKEEEIENRDVEHEGRP